MPTLHKQHRTCIWHHFTASCHSPDPPFWIGARGLLSVTAKSCKISCPDYVKIMRLSSHVFAVNTADGSLLSEHFHAVLSEVTPDPCTKVQRNTAALQRLHEGKDDLCIPTCSCLHVADSGLPWLSQKFIFLCKVKPRFWSKARLDHSWAESSFMKHAWETPENMIMFFLKKIFTCL